MTSKRKELKPLIAEILGFCTIIFDVIYDIKRIYSFRAYLHSPIFFNIVIYDICGDCNWQYDFVKNIHNENAKYIGMDISNHALTRAKNKNVNLPKMSFVDRPIDLSKTVLDVTDGESSLMLVKEVIQHLPLEMGLKDHRYAFREGM